MQGKCCEIRNYAFINRCFGLKQNLNKMKNEKIKFSWKHRIIFAITSGLVFALILYLFDLFSVENTQTINGLMFQGVLFGILFGLGFPYVSEKFGGRFTTNLDKKNKPLIGRE